MTIAVSTLFAPIDDSHPVSGNRKWGFEAKPNGGYTFYVTGADRLTLNVYQYLQSMTGIPFKAADNLWKSYQNKVANFVNQNSGTATIG